MELGSWGARELGSWGAEHGTDQAGQHSPQLFGCREETVGLLWVTDTDPLAEQRLRFDLAQ